MRSFAGLLVVLSLVAFAAGPADAARPRPGVTAAPQLTQLVARSYELIGTPDVTYRFTGSGGVTLELPLRGGLALVSGLEYGEHLDEQGWPTTVNINGTLIGGDSKRELRMRTLSLPARLEWRPGRWRFGAGPEARYLVGADARWLVTEPTVIRDPGTAPGRRGRPAALIFESVGADRWYDTTSDFRRWSLAAQFAAGVELPAGPHAMRADLRWSEGITHQQWLADATQRTRAVQLALAFLW